MAGAVELATAYISLIPSMKGASQKITEQITPAAAEAGESGGASLGGMLLGGLKRFAAPIAVLAAGFGIHKVIEESTEAFEQLGQKTFNMSRIAGGSAQQVSSLTGALQMFGMDSDKTQVSLGMFSKNLGNATKDGKSASAMVSKLGFDFRDAHGQVLPMSDIMPKLADRFQHMPDGAQKTALAMQLFGRSGAQMVPFLNQGSKGLEELEAKAKSSGLVLDDVSMRIFMQGKLSTAAWTGAIQGAKVALGQDLAPVLEAFHNSGRGMIIPLLNDFASFMNKARDPALKLAEGMEKLGERGADAVKGLLAVISGKGFTEELGKAFNLTDNSALVGNLIAMRDKVAGAFGEIGKLFTNAKAGFKMPRLDTSPMSRGLAEAVKFGADLRGTFDKVRSFLSGAFANIGPIMQPFVAAFHSLAPTLGPLIPQLMSLYSSLSPVQLIFKAILPVLPALVGAIGQLAGSAFKALLAIVVAVTPVAVQLSNTLIHLLSGVIVALMPTVVTVVQMLGRVFAQLGPMISTVLTALMPLVTIILGVAIQAFTTLLPPILAIVTMALPMLVQILSVVIGAIAPLVQILAAVLIPIIRALLPVVTVVFNTIAAVIRAALSIVQGIIQVVLGIITGNWGMVWNGIKGILSGIWNVIIAVVTGAVHYVQAVIGAYLNIISGIWNAIWSGISSFLGGIWNGIVGAVSGAIAFLSSAISGVLNFISGLWNSVWSGIGSFLGGIWNGIVNSVSSGIGRVMGFVGGLPGQIMGALSGAAGWLFNVGKDIINGLISGIGSMVGAIGNAILSLIPGPIVGVFKAALGIHSPSRVFRGFGQNIVEGLMLGTDDKAGDLSNTMSGLVTVPATPSFRVGVAGGTLTAGANRGGSTFHTTINQVDDPIGTAHAVQRRLTSLAI